MSGFFKIYKKEFETETMQFIFLSDRNDAKLLVGEYCKENLSEYARLACIIMVFGYKRLFLKLMAKLENDLNEFLKELDNLNGKFDLLDGWINGFINAIKDQAAQKLAREYWEEQKIAIDKDNFSVRQLLSL